MKSSTRSSGTKLSPLAQRAIAAFGFLVPPGSSLGVAVSGGSDSMALLMLAAEFRNATGDLLRAVTVDHGLRPEARDEARFVGRVCETLGVRHEIVRWERGADGSVGQDAARRARHALLADWAKRNDVAQIALGHTRDDRLETFLIRVRQGSGWYGLAGPMPNSVSPVWPEGRLIPLLRPLLAFERSELRDELTAQGVAWVEDPSNDAVQFERVRMRKLLARMSPATRRQILAMMDRLMEVRASVLAEAQALFEMLQPSRRAGELCVPLQAQRGASAEAWKRFIEAVIMAAGGSEHAPKREALDRLLAGIAAHEARLAKGVTLAGARIQVASGEFLSFGRAPPRRGEHLRIRGAVPDWERGRALLTVPDLRILAV